MLSLALRKRNAVRKGATYIHCGFNGHAPSLDFHELLCNVEAKTRAPLRTRTPPEYLVPRKELLHNLRRNAPARVSDLNNPTIPFLSQADGNSSFLCVFHGIADGICHCLCRFLSIGKDSDLLSYILKTE